jgi:hypothetical protein
MPRAPGRPDASGVARARPQTYIGGVRPETRYAKSGDISVAYQVVGDGPIDLVLVPGFVSHVELGWEEPSSARLLTRLASFSRLIIFDKRGTGMSDPMLYCLGCCWALMAVLFVVGLVNLAWMAVIAAVFLAEKNWRHGVALVRVVGTAVLGFGVAVLIDPSLLGVAALLRQAPAMMMSG